MNYTLFSALLAAIYPPFKDFVELIVKNRGSLSKAKEAKHQLVEMATVIRRDLRDAKDEISTISELCASLGIPLEERGAMPWKLPQGINAISRWKYRRSARKIRNISDQFSESIVGMMSMVDCLTGVSKGIVQAGDDQDIYETPDWVGDLKNLYDDVSEKLIAPDKYSVNEYTNAIEVFLDKTGIALQKLERLLR